MHPLSRVNTCTDAPKRTICFIAGEAYHRICKAVDETRRRMKSDAMAPKSKGAQVRRYCVHTGHRNQSSPRLKPGGDVIVGIKEEVSQTTLGHSKKCEQTRSAGILPISQIVTGAEKKRCGIKLRIAH